MEAPRELEPYSLLNVLNHKLDSTQPLSLQSLIKGFVRSPDCLDIRIAELKMGFEARHSKLIRLV